MPADSPREAGPAPSNRRGTEAVERTGRSEQVAPNQGFGAPGSVREQTSGVDENEEPDSGDDGPKVAVPDTP